MNEMSRRAVLRAGAWSVPVVAVAVAAPAAAASGGLTHPLGVAFDPSSVIIRRGTTLRSEPVNITVTNNTDRDTRGPVTVTFPYRKATAGLFVADVTSATDWAFTQSGDTVALQSVGPLQDGSSLSFQVVLESVDSSPDWNFRTGQTLIYFSVSAPGSNPTTYPLWAATVPER